ncbi:MAG: 6-pyruvoyl trahydropterin synthase family protein [Candidatus Hodarchaeales archaeon]
MPSKTNKASVGLHKFANHFSASHILLTEDFSEGLHGHNYYVEIELFGRTNDDEIIINFLSLDKYLTDILSQWDHYTLLPSKNKELKFEEIGNNYEIHFGDRFYSIPRNEIKLLNCSNVTAEFLAKTIATQVTEYFQPKNDKTNIEEIIVHLWETPFYFASYSIHLSRA